MIFASFTVKMERDIPIVDYYTWLLAKGRYIFRAKLEDGVYKIPPDNISELLGHKREDVDASPKDDEVPPESCRPKVPKKKDVIKTSSRKRGFKATPKRVLTVHPVEINVPMPVSVPTSWKLINLEADLVRVNNLVDQTKKEMFDTFADVDFEREILLRKEALLIVRAYEFENLLLDMRFVEDLYQYFIQEEHDKQAQTSEKLEKLRTDLRPIAWKRDVLFAYLRKLKRAYELVTGFLELPSKFSNLKEANEELERQAFAYRELFFDEREVREAFFKAFNRNREFFSVDPAAEERIVNMVIDMKYVYLENLRSEEIFLYNQLIKIKDYEIEKRGYLQKLRFSVERMFREFREKLPVVLERRGDRVEMLRKVGYLILDSDDLITTVTAIVVERERQEAEDRRRINFLRGLFRIKIKSYEDKKF